MNDSMAMMLLTLFLGVVFAAIGFLAKYAIDQNTEAVRELKAQIGALAKALGDDRQRITRLEEWRSQQG